MLKLILKYKSNITASIEFVCVYYLTSKTVGVQSQ